MRPLIRLDRLLSNRGYCSRRSLRDDLGHVKVDGKTPRRSDEKVKPEEVTWDDEPLDGEKLYLLMHKPGGLTCSHREEGELVYSLFPERYLQRNPTLSSVGRLDKDTTGSLLFTDDGDMLHRLTSPKHKVAKLYEAELSEDLLPEHEQQLTSGELVLDEQPVRPASLELLEPRRALLTLVEGRYHQVKRMFAAVGNEVLRLHRREFGGLGVTDLEVGTWRHLTPEEVKSLGR